MATVYKRKGWKNWYASYTDADGNRIQKSTGTEAKKEAQHLAFKWERDALKSMEAQRTVRSQFSEVVVNASRDASAGALTLDRARGYIMELYRLSNDEEFPTYTIGQWLDYWLKSVSQQIGPSTHSRYSLSVSDTKKALGSKASKNMQLLTTEDVSAVQQKLKKSGTKASTVNFKIQDFKSAIRAAFEQGVIDRNVGAPIKALPTEDSDIRGEFTPTEIEKLITAAKPDWKGAIIIGAHTGLRLSNVTNLCWENVDLENSVLILKPVKQRRGKKRVIPIPLSSSVMKLFHSIDAKKRGYVFKSLGGRTAATHSTAFSNLMTKAGVAKRIEIPGGDLAPRSFHSLRHFFISELANSEVPEDVRKSLSAHKSKEDHLIYTHHDQKTLTSAINKMRELSLG